MLDSPVASINPAWRCLGRPAHRCTPSLSRMLSACPLPAPSPAEISAILPRQAAPAVPAPPAQARPSSRDNVQRATSVPSLSSISSPEGLSGGGEGRGGEGPGPAPPLLCPHVLSLVQAGWARESSCSWRNFVPGVAPWEVGVGEYLCWGAGGGKRVPMPRVVGVLRHRTQAEVGPCVPRQWEWKVSHGHLPRARAGRGVGCTFAHGRPEHRLG